MPDVETEAAADTLPPIDTEATFRAHGERVSCAGCGKTLRRAFEPRGGKASASGVYTRTLVGGEFLPSCSPGCAAAVRRRGSA